MESNTPGERSWRRGWHQYGSTLLRWRGELSLRPGDCLVDLEAFTRPLKEWMTAGGLLGVQAIHPLWEVGSHKLRQTSFLAVGPGSQLAAIVALHYGIGRVGLTEANPPWATSLEEEMATRFHPIPSAMPESEDQFQHLLLACGGQAMDDQEVARWLPSLAGMGQFTLSGFPLEDQEENLRRLGKRGFFLSSAGQSDGLAFLSGSLEHRRSWSS
ncbi:MAG: hypothetical protein DWQ01_20675 [Planctomycetota bacterium]|nr:MAG: hypothetical protein DWQ01_20675 [Planctomycetota bacterium]